MNRRDTRPAAVATGVRGIAAVVRADNEAETLAGLVAGAMPRIGMGTGGAGLLSLTARTVLAAVQGVARIRAVDERAAKSIMVGALEGACTIGEITLGTIAVSGAALVLGIFEAGGDLALAARAAVKGAVRVARAADASASEAAMAAASGALRAAAAIGEPAERRVREELAGPIAGVGGVRPRLRPASAANWEC